MSQKRWNCDDFSGVDFLDGLDGLDGLEDAVASAGKLSMWHNSVVCNAFLQYMQHDIFEIIKNTQIYQSDRQKKIYYLLYYLLY